MSIGRLDSAGRLDSETDEKPTKIMSVQRLDSEIQPQPNIPSVGRLGSDQEEVKALVPTV